MCQRDGWWDLHRGWYGEVASRILGCRRGVPQRGDQNRQRSLHGQDRQADEIDQTPLERRGGEEENQTKFACRRIWGKAWTKGQKEKGPQKREGKKTLTWRETKRGCKKFEYKRFEFVHPEG
ncbi:hypothetical protein BX600DRAFT_155562 [Xylariales sp. PMI_506]|nr:hypothetical protein BX600DRAFT_155562 [Xylariales sp. PMI_506]